MLLQFLEAQFLQAAVFQTHKTGSFLPPASLFTKKEIKWSDIPGEEEKFLIKKI